MSNSQLSSASDRIGQLLSALASRERRIILTHLHTMSEAVTSVAELARVHATKTGGDLAQATTRLHHAHLPRLAYTPLLEYDAHSATIRYHGDPAIESLLETMYRLESVTSTPDS